MCFNNNTVVNNNYWRFRDLTLFFKIPTGTRKKFFEICRQFEHAPSKTFASLGLWGHQFLKYSFTFFPLYVGFCHLAMTRPQVMYGEGIQTDMTKQSRTADKG